MVNDQLKKIGFKRNGWGQSEAAELPKIILPDEEIYECVNGIYEGGFALLVATNIRLILVDKKPLNYLTVEDVRYDMISEMDYNHRLMGADIRVSAGSKTLKFRSYNQPRLRKLINHVQHCIAESKQKQNTNQEDQIQHLQDINKQLQSYLIAQQQYQQQVQESDAGKHTDVVSPEPPKPSHELADFLYAQSLLAQYQQSINSQARKLSEQSEIEETPQQQPEPLAQPQPETRFVSKEDNPTLLTNTSDLEDIYDEGMKEVFSNKPAEAHKPHHAIHAPKISISTSQVINPIQIAYSKLPQALHARKSNQENSEEGQLSNTVVPTTYTINA